MARDSRTIPIALWKSSGGMIDLCDDLGKLFSFNRQILFY